MAGKTNKPAPQSRSVKATALQVISEHAGPLPAPATMNAYEQILPGAAERILTMAEKQLDHRQRLETTAIKTDSRNSFAGIICAELLGITAILGGCFLAYHGKELGGLSISGGGLASLVGAFLWGTRQRRLERESKFKSMQRQR